jgi:hypothetical protein
MIALDAAAQRPPRRQQMLLANHLIERARAHTLGERLGVRGRAIARQHILRNVRLTGRAPAPRGPPLGGRVIIAEERPLRLIVAHRAAPSRIAVTPGYAVSAV